jgi:two-component system NtrC family response regulator
VLPPSAQNRLLSFLQTAELTDNGRKLDVRMISASTTDLRSRIREGAFREDLFYRLNVIPVHLPGLAEHAEDIELLAAHFVTVAAAEMHRPIPAISPAVMERLRTHRWPGNIRELENTLRRALALCNSHEIQPGDISFVGRLSTETQKVTEDGPRRLTVKRGRLDDGQCSLIQKALEANDWNCTRTAAELGIGRTTLWRKIRKYNLERETAEAE